MPRNPKFPVHSACIISSLCVVASLSAFVQPTRAQSTTSSANHSPRVLQVGTFKGKPGSYYSIQAAVNDARPGDWILIAPGTYHEHGADIAGVYIKTPGIHLRGMDRNKVVVDGTNPNPAICSSNTADQNLGVAGNGRNGIEVFKVDGVSVENLTVCNFLGTPSGNNGNQIWWNGGDSSGKIGMGSYFGAYLTASSTFFDLTVPYVAQYGIFSSNAKGHGAFLNSYASNMSDSSFYVGACPDCNAALNNVHAQNSAQGYSGSNAGGHLVIENSEWDHNQSGIVPSSLANDDPPSPQDGACPHNPTKSCTLIQYNYVHDNNNPNTPAAGLAATSLIGSGIDLTGGRNNTVQFNLVVNNGSWGIVANDYPDFTSPIVPAYCNGGTLAFNTPPPFDLLYGSVVPCFFNSFGNLISGNVFFHNGFFGNDTNGDLANAALSYPTNNCFTNNFDVLTGGPSTSPLNLQDPAIAGTCGAAWNPDTSQEFNLVDQLGCASLGVASGACAGLPPPLYPTQTQVQLFPIPHEASMPNPCSGVPQNSWCQP
jgi:hypothetical protein